MTAVSLNNDQRLFVLNHGGGISCLGFDVVFKRLCQFARLLGRSMPAAEDIGTMGQYDAYCQAEQAYIATRPQGTLFDPDTAPMVQALLESYRQARGRVRLFLGDPATGRDWLEEHDVIGTIGRSMGPLKVPLLVPAGADGGGAILTANILRIVDVGTKSEVYRHGKYRTPVFKTRTSDTPGYTVAVYSDGELRARFKSGEKAERWMAFMQGTRMTPN